MNHHPSFTAIRYTEGRSYYTVSRAICQCYSLYVINLHCIWIGWKIEALHLSPVLTSHAYYLRLVIPNMTIPQLNKRAQMSEMRSLDQNIIHILVLLIKLSSRKREATIYDERPFSHTLAVQSVTVCLTLKIFRMLPNHLSVSINCAHKLSHK